MTPQDIITLGAGVCALFLIFTTFYKVVNDIAPVLQKLNVHVENSENSTAALSEAVQSLSSMIEILDETVRGTTQTYIEHDKRAARMEVQVGIALEKIDQVGKRVS